MEKELSQLTDNELLEKKKKSNPITFSMLYFWE